MTKLKPMNQRERLIGWIMDSVGGCARHWAEVIADGILERGGLAPPCKVGDVVYDIGGFPKIMKAEVETMTTDGQEMSSVVVEPQKPFHRWFVNWKDLGKYVFLTREAAEKALKERETK